MIVITSLFSSVLLNAKELLASSSAVQALLGAEDKAAAESRIFLGYATTSDAPPRIIVAIINWGSSRRGVAAWEHNVDLLFKIEREADGVQGATPSAKYAQFLALVEPVLDEIRAAVDDGSGKLFGTRLECVTVPYIAQVEGSEDSTKDRFVTEFVLTSE